MSVGFDVHEDKRTFEQEGITGSISRFAKVDVKYPYFMLVNSSDKKIPLYRIKTLPALLVNSKTREISVEEDKKSIEVYFRDEDKIVRLGKILPHQVKSFLGLFSEYDVECMLTENQKLTGDMMYILSD